MAKSFKPAGYDGKDSVRNVIKSHNTMLVSFPTELKLRAGLARGVTVRTDYCKEDPHVLIVTVQNPHDYGSELSEFLNKEADKLEKAAKKIERKTSKKKRDTAKEKMSTSEQEIRADATKYGVDMSYYPEGWRKGDAYLEGHPMFEPPEAEAEPVPEPIEDEEA